jgi:5'-methylthioadenosine phosphorylase
VSTPTTRPVCLGVIGGSTFLESVGLAAVHHDITTSHGVVSLHDAGDVIVIRRHGEDGYRPPHRIPHHAHVLALEAMGVHTVVGFASVGALHERLRPGDVLIPDDYLSLAPPPTFATDEYLHIVPALDSDVRTLLLEAARTVALTHTALRHVHDGGVYAETRGPRFETKAEIRMLAQHADIVGMTAASEATLCQERSLNYAVLCTIDNWANGVGRTPLTITAFQQQLAENTVVARAILREIVRRWRTTATEAT